MTNNQRTLSARSKMRPTRRRDGQLGCSFARLRLPRLSSGRADNEIETGRLRKPPETREEQLAPRGHLRRRNESPRQKVDPPRRMPSSTSTSRSCWPVLLLLLLQLVPSKSNRLDFTPPLPLLHRNAGQLPLTGSNGATTRNKQIIRSAANSPPTFEPPMALVSSPGLLQQQQHPGELIAGHKHKPLT